MTVLRYEARSAADPAVAWALYARPARWPEWAPHVRGAWGLGAGEVRPGARGAVRLLGVLPVPVEITAKEAGRSWRWRLGPVDMDHHVRPLAGGGCVVAVDIRAPGPLEDALRVSYGPLAAASIRRLARAAERS